MVMKQILLVDLGKQFGGAEQYVIQIGTLLANRYQIHFLVRNSSLLSKKLQEMQLGPVLEIAFNRASIWGDIHLVKKYLFQNQISLVHANGINSEVFLAICGIQNQVKLVTTVHGIAEFDRIEKRPFVRTLFAKMQILSLKSFHRIIAVSESIKENLIEKKVEPQKITTIYHGISVDRPLPPYTMKYRPLRICCVGRLEKVKNISFLIEALHELTDIENIECDVYGTGSELKKLQELTVRYNLQDHVRFKGYSTDVNQVYRSHDLLVQPSLYESFGLTVIEAMSNGTPVLCAQVGGMKEIVHQGINGLLFSLEDPKKLAEQIHEIANGAVNLELLRENAYREIQERYSIARMMGALCKVYDNERDKDDDKDCHKQE